MCGEGFSNRTLDKLHHLFWSPSRQPLWLHGRSQVDSREERVVAEAVGKVVLMPLANPHRRCVAVLPQRFVEFLTITTGRRACH